MDESGRFSLTFYNDEFKSKLNYLGTVSGRDEDKIQNSGLSLEFYDGIPYFNEARLAVFCKNLYKQKYAPENFVDEKLIDLWYQKSDFHTLYIAEIEKVLVKE